MRWLVLLCTISIYGDMFTNGCLDQQEVYDRVTTLYHGSAVEPTLAVNPRDGNQLVAAWQKDRTSNGAALDVGIAYSNDGGHHWHRSDFTFQICEGGISQRSGDFWLSYSGDGSRVYLCTAILNATQVPGTQNQWGVVVNFSTDNGKTWSAPQFVFSSMNYLSEPTKQFPNSDKNSMTADPNDPCRAIAVWVTFNPASSFYGPAYGSYTKNSGDSWSAPQMIYDPFPDLTSHGLGNGIQNDCQASNNIVAILPKKKSKKHRYSGDWLNFTTRIYATPTATNEQFVNDAFPYQYTLADIAIVRSKDHGVHWDPTATVIVPSYVNNLVYTGGYAYDAEGNITAGIGTLMRNDQTVPSINVNSRNGYLYAVYQSSQFRADKLAQIGLSTSRDGGYTWSKGVQVSRTPSSAPNPQAFQPFVAVTYGGRVGVLYFDFRNDDLTDPVSRTKMDAWFAIYQEVKDPNGGSTGVGLDFVQEIRLSDTSYIAQNGPTTTSGNMTDADYQFITTSGDCFYLIYTKSLNGPFTPAFPIFVDPVHNATVLLDNNLRTVPFFSVIRNQKEGAKLLFTTDLGP